MKKHLYSVVAISLFVPLISFADDVTTVTVIGTQPSTMNDNPWYNSGSSAPSGGNYGGYGASYSAAMAQKKAAECAGAKSGILAAESNCEAVESQTRTYATNQCFNNYGEKDGNAYSNCTKTVDVAYANGIVQCKNKQTQQLNQLVQSGCPAQ